MRYLVLLVIPGGYLFGRYVLGPVLHKWGWL